MNENDHIDTFFAGAAYTILAERQEMIKPLSARLNSPSKIWTQSKQIFFFQLINFSEHLGIYLPPATWFISLPDFFAFCLKVAARWKGYFLKGSNSAPLFTLTGTIYTDGELLL